MATPLPDSWQPALAPVLATRPLRALGGFLSAEEAAGKVIFPPRGSRLRALEPVSYTHLTLPTILLV